MEEVEFFNKFESYLYLARASWTISWLPILSGDYGCVGGSSILGRPGNLVTANVAIDIVVWT